MAHKREEIRKSVLAMLSAPVDDVYPTAAGSNVFANRIAPLWDIELPAILIYPRSESSTPRAVGRRQLIRTLNLVIELVNEASDELDDSLDDLAQQVETIISSDPSLGAKAISTILTSTETTLDEGKKLIGKMTLSFEVIYIE